MLSDKGIRTLLREKKLRIEPFSEKSIGCASIDLTLAEQFVRYTATLDTRSQSSSHERFGATALLLEPGQFVLGMTKERVRVPDGHYGFVETRGNFSRAGISVTCDDGHIDPGTDGTITLEIKNNNTVPIRLYAGDHLCQLFLFKLSSPCLKTYAGKYSKQDCPTVFRM